MTDKGDEENTPCTLPKEIAYNPSNFGIVNTYREVETIYDERLASSTVWTVKPREASETLLIKKSILKSKLFGED